MAKITYQYLSFEFKRPPLKPLSEEEYVLVQNNFEPFLASFLERAEAEFRKQKNPHRFQWKPFFILLGVGGSLLGISFVVRAMKHPDAADVLSVLAVFPLGAIVFQPVLWFLSFMKSSSFSDYEDKARTYYCFHEKKVKASADYADYRRLISETDKTEFEAFEWNS